MNSLLLDTVQWDLVLDANGDIALAANPYALAQDVASALRTFSGEVYYDTTQGIPYWSQILGHMPPPQIIKNAYVSAALAVPDVVSAVCYLRAVENRQITGQVQITDSAGNTAFITG